MRLRDGIILFVCIVLAAGLLIGAGMQLDSINRQREDMDLIIDKPENIPPSLAFATIATGAFRGLVVDILWMRADKLKEEGQFFDARQLAEWITILQPRFASVWEFHAWNMAYNISVAIPATQPDQRWQWVKNGYELLRDEAIDKFKLKNITLYRELGRIFQHKIGGVSDDAHKYYKLQLALAMEPLLGPADNQYFDAIAGFLFSFELEFESDSDLDSDTISDLDSGTISEELRQEFEENQISLSDHVTVSIEQPGSTWLITDNLKKYYVRKDMSGQEKEKRRLNIYEAPVSWQEISKDPNVAPLIKALKSADEPFSDDDEFVSNYLSLRQNSRRFNAAAGKTIDDFRGTKTLDKFDTFAKAWQLRKAWKLDPVLMRDLNKAYGPINFSDPNTHLPLDWRHPDSHAIYWTVKGLQIAAKEDDREIEMNEVNTDRIVGHSLQNLFRNGKIFIYELSVPASSQEPKEQPQTQIYKEVFLRPDLRIFKPYNDSVLAILKKYKDTEDEGRYQTLQNGHRNMLKNAVLSFYQSGHKREAQQIYDQLRKLYPMEEFKVRIEEFARARFVEELQTLGINDAKEQIILLLRESYYLYAIRDDNTAYAREKMAEEVWNYYMVKHDDPEYRIDLPKFPRLRYFAMLDFIYDELYPPYLRQTLLGRIKIERPELLRKLEAQGEELRKESEQAK